MAEGTSGSRSMNLTNFIADLLSSGVTIIRDEDVQRTKVLATGNTFTVCRGLYRRKVVAIKYFNFTAPQDMFSSLSLEVAGEILRENLANASHEIRIMTNNILRRCPNIATLEGVFFETEDPAWIRPGLVMELAYDVAPTLTELLRMPQTPLVKRSIVNNLFDGLYALHSVQICHGDVKPDNVLIFSTNLDPRIPYQARVSDFGFAFISGQTPRGSGTEGWCAPECYHESSEPLWREKAFGRDVYSAALVMKTIFSAPSTARPSIEEEQNSFDCNLSMNERIRQELEPQMLSDRPENRPWIEDLRQDLRKSCEIEAIGTLQWSWVAKGASITQREIEPVGVSAEMKGQISSWLIAHHQVENLSVHVRETLFQELKAGAADTDDPARADNLHALSICYSRGKLTVRDSQKAWDCLLEASRAGSQHAQKQSICRIMQSRDFSCSTAVERRDWSLVFLMPSSHLDHKLLKQVDAPLCDKGLRAVVYDRGTAQARRSAKSDCILPLSTTIQDRLKPQYWSIVSPLIPDITLAVSSADFECLQLLLSCKCRHDRAREALLQVLLEYTILNRQKELMYFLVTRYSVDALVEDPETHRNALITAIFEDRNDAVTWLLDLGVDRKIFASQHIFGRIVCNGTWAMTTTYIQACRTYYRNFGFKKMLNESALPVQGKSIPPPLILSILSRNGDSFAAILRYNPDVNQRWGIWNPLLLTVAQGLPHFTAQLIEKGAKIIERTTDDAAMTIAHVLADARACDATNEDPFLWDMFDRAPEDRSGSPLTQSQARRYTDYLLYAILKDIGVSFDVRDSAGNLPLEAAILSGKLWVAALIETNDKSNSSMTTKEFQDLQDIDGRTLLSYAIEDGDHLLANELLAQGYDINCSNIMGKTALHEAAENSQLANLFFCLHHGANGQHRDIFGHTALIHAVTNGDAETCKAIVSHIGTVLLLERNTAQETFLHSCVKKNRYETLEALLDHYLEVQDADGLPKLSEFLGYVDVSGRTCLHSICLPGKQRPNAPMDSALKRLLLLSPDVSAADCVGDTPLHDGADNSNSQENCLRCCKALIAAGANVNYQNGIGNTPLHHAYQRQGEKQQLIDLLLESGADPALKNNYGLTPDEWRQAKHAGTEATKEADQEYKRLYDQRSGWRTIKSRIQEAKRENEGRCAQNRLSFLESYRRSMNAVSEPRRF